MLSFLGRIIVGSFLGANTVDCIEGYFDKSLFKTEFALGFNFFETNYGSLEIITKYNTKQSDIFMKLSNILTVNYVII